MVHEKLQSVTPPSVYTEMQSKLFFEKKNQAVIALCCSLGHHKIKSTCTLVSGVAFYTGSSYTQVYTLNIKYSVCRIINTQG